MKTEALNTRPYVGDRYAYRLRLLRRFFWYDHAETGLSYEFPEGAIVTDPDAIKFLEAHGAPVEVVP